MKKLLCVLDYFVYIVQVIECIKCYMVDIDEVGFLVSEFVQDVVIRNIEIVGEVVNNIQREVFVFVMVYVNIFWQVMYVMCNWVLYGYYVVDLEVVWKMVYDDFLVFCDQIWVFFVCID